MSLGKYLANPLIAIVSIVIILIVILSIFRAANLGMGFGVHARIGSLKGSFMIEGYEGMEGAGAEGPCLVMFHASWCGHCKTTLPQFNLAKGEYSGSVKMIAIESEDPGAAALMKQEGVNSFPTIRYYKNGPPAVGKKMDYDEYDGGRSKEDFLQFLSQKA